MVLLDSFMSIYTAWKQRFPDSGNPTETFWKPSWNLWFPEGFRMVSGVPETWFVIFSGWFPVTVSVQIPEVHTTETYRKPSWNHQFQAGFQKVSGWFPVNRKLGLPYFQDGFRSVSWCSHTGNLPETTRFWGFRWLNFISMRFPVDIAAWFTEPNAIKLLLYTSF